MLTMQMALQINQQMTLLLNVQTMLPKVLPLTILKISQMTLLLNLQRMLLKVLPLTVLEISQQVTLLLNVQLMLLKVLPLQIMVQWVLPRNLLVSDGPMNCCSNCAALLSWRPGPARGKF